MPKSRKYEDLFPYGASREDENVEPYVNGIGKNKTAAPGSSGRVPLQPPSKGAATTKNKQNNADFMEGNEAEKRRRILVREREDELTQNLALARKQAEQTGSDLDRAAALRAEKMVNVNRAATSKSRSDWVGVGIVINDPPTCEILGISPHAQIMNGATYAPVRDDKVKEINEVPLENLTVSEVRALIVGPPGTAVSLAIERYDGKAIQVDFTRKHVGNAPPRPSAPRPKAAPAPAPPKTQPQKQPTQPEAQQQTIVLPGAGATRKEDVQRDITRMSGLSPRKQATAEAASAPAIERGSQAGLFVYQGRVVRKRQSVRAGGRVELVELVEVSSGTVVYQGDGIPLGDMTVLMKSADDMDEREQRKEALQEQRRAIPASNKQQPKKVFFFDDDDDDDESRRAQPVMPTATAGPVRQQPAQPFLAPRPQAAPAGLGQLRTAPGRVGGEAPVPAAKTRPPTQTSAPVLSRGTGEVEAREAREATPSWNAGSIMCMCVGDRSGGRPPSAQSTLRHHPALVSRPAATPQRGVVRSKPAAVEPRPVTVEAPRREEYPSHSESGKFSAALGVPKPSDALERGFTNMFRHNK